MSNIEPTVTRTMRCPTCNAVGVHTIDASMRNEAVLCPACAESGKRSACVVVNPNEPTEEQKQAAREWIALDLDMRYGVDHVAMLLAEREAKLREGSSFFVAKVGEQHKELIAQEEELERRGEKILELRARVAELEGQVSESTRLRMTETLHGMGVEAMYQEREAQHLADIKALMEALKGFLVPAALTIEFNPGVRARALLQRLAHYDDAKAAETIVDRLTKGET